MTRRPEDRDRSIADIADIVGGEIYQVSLLCKASCGDHARQQRFPYGPFNHCRSIKGSNSSSVLTRVHTSIFNNYDSAHDSTQETIFSDRTGCASSPHLSGSRSQFVKSSCTLLVPLGFRDPVSWVILHYIRQYRATHVYCKEIACEG